MAELVYQINYAVTEGGKPISKETTLEGQHCQLICWSELSFSVETREV